MSALRTTSMCALLALALGAGWGCGGTKRAHRGAQAARPAPWGPAFGLTEDNAQLLLNPQVAQAGPVSADAAGSPRLSRGGSLARNAAALAREAAARVRVAAARRELTELHPGYIRLLIDWAALQPDAGRAPSLEEPVSGCARNVGPCTPYAGVRDELAAIASQQRAARAQGGAEFQVLLDIFGTPAWATRPPAACESGSAGAFSRLPTAAGLAAYRALIRALLALGAREGVSLTWWSPWNEPNNALFLSPQQGSCGVGAAPGALRSPVSYAQLVRAMAAELRAAGGEHHIVLGELAGSVVATADRASVAQFVAGLPADVLCDASAWSVHAYAPSGASAPAADPVTALESALAARGGCAANAPIWVTETGTGAPHAGQRRPAGQALELAGCLALARQVLGWYRDARVGAVFQYTFREDPAFQVGLVGPELSRSYPAYRFWLALAQARLKGERPPSPDSACAR